MNCTGEIPGHAGVGPLRFNLLYVDLARLRVKPMVAANHTVQPLPTILAQDPAVLAGINGGYFWRTDVSSFKDDVCRGKTRADALLPASPANPNAGTSIHETKPDV